MGGYILEKLAKDKTKATSFVEVDFKEDIPELMKEKLLRHHGGRVGRIESAMKNHYKKMT